MYDDSHNPESTSYCKKQVIYICMNDISKELAPRKELISWAMYDFANSGYTTVVLTAIYSAYFVRVIAATTDGTNNGIGILLWSVSIGVANILILISAPILGAIADYSASKRECSPIPLLAV